MNSISAIFVPDVFRSSGICSFLSELPCSREVDFALAQSSCREDDVTNGQGYGSRRLRNSHVFESVSFSRSGFTSAGLPTAPSPYRSDCFGWIFRETRSAYTNNFLKVDFAMQAKSKAVAVVTTAPSLRDVLEHTSNSINPKNGSENPISIHKAHTFILRCTPGPALIRLLRSTPSASTI